MKTKLLVVLFGAILFASCNQKLDTESDQYLALQEITGKRHIFPQWNKNEVYFAENKVTWKEQLWQTPYWSQNEEPGKKGAWYKITKNELPVDPLEPGYYIGETIKVTPEKLESRWGGIDEQYLPEAVTNSIQNLMSKETYEELFPRRYGSTGWSAHSGREEEEYYSYSNLIEALIHMSNIKLRIETRDYTRRVFRLNKKTLEETFLREDSDFCNSWLIYGPTEIDIVDFGKFVNEGSLYLRKKDLAAFLANISHETTGGWPTAEGGPYAWGLYFNQEVGHNSESVGGYSTGYHAVYPSNPDVSYHGRGPIQLSWNYNYGYVSQVLYNDKSILLDDPDRVAASGKLGFMTAIWFWMTPQPPKPSCHNIITGNWIPSEEDISKNRLVGFGTTINVINGSQEAGIPNDSRVIDRIGFYKKITTGFGIDPGQNLDCFTQQPF